MVNIRLITAAIALAAISGNALALPSTKRSPFGDRWYHLLSGQEGLSAPLVIISYKNGYLRRYGKNISLVRLLRELREMIPLEPRPRVKLIVDKDEAVKARRLIHMIERTGICDDTGCLYEYSGER